MNPKPWERSCKYSSAQLVDMFELKRHVVGLLAGRKEGRNGQDAKPKTFPLLLNMFLSKLYMYIYICRHIHTQAYEPLSLYGLYLYPEPVAVKPKP